MLNQFQFCEDNGVPFCVVIGESELQKDEATLRDMNSREEVITWFFIYQTLGELCKLNGKVYVLAKWPIQPELIPFPWH